MLKSRAHVPASGPRCTGGRLGSSDSRAIGRLAGVALSEWLLLACWCGEMGLCNSVSKRFLIKQDHSR